MSNTAGGTSVHFRVAHPYRLFLCCPIMCLYVLVPCGDVCYDFHIKTKFGSSLPPESYLRYLCLFTYSNVQYVVFCFVCLRLVCTMLPVSLDCPFLIVALVFSSVYLHNIWVLIFR